MSLVNRMLLDLEERQSLPVGQPALAGLSSVDYCSGEGRPGRSAGRAAPLAAAALVAALTLALATPWFGGNAPGVMPEKIRPAVADAPALAAPAVTVEPAIDAARTPVAELSLRLDETLASLVRLAVRDAAPATSAPPGITVAGPRTVMGMTLSGDGQHTLLDLELDGEVRYRAYSLDDPSRVVVELPNTTLRRDLPQVEPGGAAHRVRSREERGKSIVILDLSRRASTVGAELTTTERGTHLRVTTVTAGDEAAAAAAPEAVAAPASSPVIEPGQLIRTAAAPRSLYGDARTLCDSGRVAACLGNLTELLVGEPGHVEGRLLLARTLAEHGDGAQAAATLDEGLAAHADVWQWAQLRAQLAIDAGDTERALAVLTPAPPSVATNPDYHALLAAVQQRTGRHVDAVATYHRVLSQRPDHGVWWMGLGISLQSLARDREAGFAYMRALDDRSLTADLRQFVESRRAALATGSGS